MAPTRSQAPKAVAPVSKVSAQKPATTEVTVKQLMAELQRCQAQLKVERAENSRTKNRLLQIEEAEKVNKKQDEDLKKFEERIEATLNASYATNKDMEDTMARKGATMESMDDMEKESNWMSEIRQRMSEPEQEQINGVENKTIRWQLCECCMLQFSAVKYERSPRFLACGHTVCLECVKMLKHPCGVRCPFDNKVTVIEDGSVEEDLPKNYSVLNMFD